MLLVRDLFRRATVIELGIALGLAYGVVNLVAMAAGFLLNAIWFFEYRGPSDRSTLFGVFHFDTPPYSFAGGAIAYGELLRWMLAVAALALIIRWIAGRARDYLWDDIELRDCPLCLSPIPAAASVCESCTRDVPPV